MNSAAKAEVVDSLLSAPGVAALCAREGYTIEALSIVIFHDANTASPWFYRQVETLGYVAAFCDGGHPLHPEAVLKDVQAAYGPKAEVLW